MRSMNRAELRRALDEVYATESSELDPELAEMQWESLESDPWAGSASKNYESDLDSHPRRLRLRFRCRPNPDRV